MLKPYTVLCTVAESWPLILSTQQLKLLCRTLLAEQYICTKHSIHCASTVQSLCRHRAGTVQLLCRHRAGTVQAPCQHCTELKPKIEHNVANRHGKQKHLLSQWSFQHSFVNLLSGSTMQLPCAVQPWCNYSAETMHASQNRNCCVNRLFHFWICTKHSIHCASTMRLLRRHRASTVQAPCNYCAGTVHASAAYHFHHEVYRRIPDGHWSFQPGD